MQRRSFLRALGLAPLGAVVTACSGAGSATDAAPRAAASPTAPVFDPVGEVTDAEEVLTVQAATFEQLVGQELPFVFGVRDIDNAPVAVDGLTVWMVPVGGAASGPFRARPADDPTGLGGLYLADLPFDQPGPVSVVAVTPDEARAGSATVPVATAETSAIPAPGQQAPVTATPTDAEPLGAATLCTQDPPCGMHEVSLDEALAAGRPVVLTFATPAYCQTAVCGPSVQVLDEVRRRGDWGETAFIHCEIYADEGQTLLEPVNEWQLQSEPWLYTIDGSGIIGQRADGPLLTLADQVTRMVADVAPTGPAPATTSPGGAPPSASPA